MLLHCTEVLSFNCGSSFANTGISYRQCTITTSVSVHKSRIHRALPKIQSHLTSSLAQLFRIACGIDLIVKTHKERFPNYHCFWSQWIYYITIDVCSCKHGAEKILSLLNIQQISAIQQWELFIHMYIYFCKIEADNQLHNCVCGALSIKDGDVTNILAKSLRKRTIELQLLWWFYIVM